MVPTRHTCHVDDSRSLPIMQRNGNRYYHSGQPYDPCKPVELTEFIPKPGAWLPR